MSCGGGGHGKKRENRHIAVCCPRGKTTAFRESEVNLKHLSVLESGESES